MEIDSKEYCLEASQGSSNELGRKLLWELAVEQMKGKGARRYAGD